MSSNWTHLIIPSCALLLLSLSPANADVAHFFAAPAEFGSYQQLDPASFQLPLTHSAVYGRPVVGSPVTPAPTTEFSLPEIVENRSVKPASQRSTNFIPLSQHYLPPAVEERPSYESPKPSDDVAGYYYPAPSSTTRNPTTSSTLRPIIVQNPDEGSELEPAEFSGYNYEAPAQQPSKPSPVYLPAAPSPVEQQQLRLRLKDMRCLQSGYFRAILKLDNFLGATPVLDNDSEQQSGHCQLKMSRSFLLLDIAGNDFERCGVQACGQDLCLRLRFPAIRGLRTGSDSILTLHCKVQQRVASKVQALKMGVANDVQSRNSGTYARGGNQNAFRTHVELLRRGTNGYTRHLESNGAVQLGEDLMVRAHVLAGDGWNYTKLSDVQLQRLSPEGEVLNSAQLISSSGCLNPAMQSICANEPNFEPPLGQRLHFRAIMFPGMLSGDLLVMSMRITGCLEHEDCQVRPQDCQPSIAQRRRRNATPTHGNATEASELSRVMFRVILPNGQQAAELEAASERELQAENVAAVSKSFALYGSLGMVVLLMGVAVVAVYKFQK
ncbi:hypothetical protein KR093_005568 [Drosophila rubida]|uniref:ZP domain-containing protein n=1 Tax=Drosophila rubida TaxID=30044 RepID=A0AAD4K955_9MUSC|nr:hypothetical protein KR093_005568 [Drosophila rubida]